jgi:hypothetical protein
MKGERKHLFIGQPLVGDRPRCPAVLAAKDSSAVRDDKNCSWIDRVDRNAQHDADKWATVHVDMIGSRGLNRKDGENCREDPNESEPHGLLGTGPPAPKIIIRFSISHVETHPDLLRKVYDALTSYRPFAPFTAHGFPALQGLAAQGFFVAGFPLAAHGFAPQGFSIATDPA